MPAKALLLPDYLRLVILKGVLYVEGLNRCAFGIESATEGLLGFSL